MTTDREQLRLRVAEMATARVCSILPEHRRDFAEIADEIYTWVTRPGPVARLVGRIGLPFPTLEGPPVMANPQVPAGFSFTITIEPEDIAGVAVADALTWTSSDAVDAPVTADTTSLVATVQVVAPATGVVVTATDGTNTFSYTFDGVVDAPVNLVATIGAPFKTPAA